MDESGGRILHRKRSPQNEGKLCPFGMNLIKYYGRRRVRNRIRGKGDKNEVSLDEALGEAKKKLEEYGEETLFVVGNATNEEISSLKSLSESIDADACSWTPSPDPVPSSASFADLENAKRITVVFSDPFIAYPLITRRILKAVEKGANVKEISFVRSERLRSSDFVKINPESPKVELEEEETEAGVIVTDLNPFTVSVPISSIPLSGGQALNLKPSVNAEGAFAMGLTPSKNKNKAKVKAVFALEPTAVEEVMLRGLSPEFLMVQSAFESSWTRRADIVWGNDAFFEKEGTVVNVEGRVLPLFGSSRSGVKIIHSLGGYDYDEARKKTLQSLGIETVKEDKPVKIKTEGEGIERRDDFVLGGAGDKTLITKTNPFFWNLNWNEGHKNFVELSRGTLSDLKLRKGEKVIVEDEGHKKAFYFKISEIPDEIIVSEVKASSKLELARRIRVESA
jgi:hypothetical protein